MLKISAVICLTCLCYVDALPHCKVVELSEGVIQGNTINVIYTMESSCKFCARKISMLPKLKASLQRAGITTHFIVAVSNKSDRLSGLNSHLSVNKRHLWKILGEQNNHFYIIDRCGRMVYEIINPWSSLQMPFLRGAIIATQFSHPCGLCPQDYAVVKEENLKIYPPMVGETQPHAEETPLGIVMKLRHKHQDDPNVYNHIVMVANGMPGHHRHLPHEMNKNTPTPTLSLNIPKDDDEAYEVSSSSNEGVKDSSRYKEQLGGEHPIHSINNLGSNSLRMANETQLTLNSSDTKDNPVLNSVFSETNTEINLNLGSSDSKDNPMLNSVSSETNTEINFTEQSNNSEIFQRINSSSKETFEELDSSYTELTTEINDNDEEISENDYNEGSEELQSANENSQLNSLELADKQNLKEHYGRILDWIKYDY